MLIDSSGKSSSVALMVAALAFAAAAFERDEDEGFVSIFDGKTLDGWTPVGADGAAEWVVRDGVIAGTGKRSALSYLVWKERELGDFELRASYRMATKGNSGIEIRAREDESRKRPFEGYHADFGDRSLGANILGAWDFHFARRKEPACDRGTRLVIHAGGETTRSAIDGALRLDDIHADGEWNEVRIIARGRRCEFWMNDKLASEFSDEDPARLEKGAIALQVHDAGMTVEFKDLELKKL